MQEVSIDSLQQQVRTFWVESREVRIFLWGCGVPPLASDLDWVPLWVISVPSSLLFLLFVLLCRLLLRRRLLPFSGRMALPVLDG